jgi:C4-dicarboxylate-binding protein DctP
MTRRQRGSTRGGPAIGVHPAAPCRRLATGGRRFAMAVRGSVRWRTPWTGGNGRIIARRRTMKHALAFVAAIALGLAVPAAAQQPIVIKFSHVAAADTPKGQAAEQFKKLAEERTKGRVKVELYPNSMLYKDKEELEALQLGSVQMLAPVPGKFGPLGLAEFEAFDLPYLFPDLDALHKVYNGPVGAGLLKKLESRGLVGLAFWDNGFRVMSANRPIHVPADMKGLKMRINSSKVNAAIMKSVGAIPQTMAFSEVYQALDTGVVDGTEGPLSNLYTQKQYEVQKHVTLTFHTISNYVVVTNKKFWDGLPPDIRKELEGAMKDATKYNDSVSAKDEATAIAGIKASGKSTIYTPTPAEKDAWVKAMLPVQDEMASRVGKDVIAAIRGATGVPK